MYFCTMKHCCCLLILFICVLHASARHYDLTVQHITTVSGLPTNLVSRIWQDSIGYIYLETRSGVFRWDGYNMSKDMHAVVPAKSKGVLQTRDAQWIHINDGALQRRGKDGSRQIWQLIPQDVVAYTHREHFHVADVDTNTEAISTYGGGLWLYDKPTGKMTRVSDDLVKTPYLTLLFVDRVGCIWVAEEYLGISCLKLNTLEYKVKRVATRPKNLDENHIRSMAILSDGQLLVGCHTGNNFRIDHEQVVAAGNTSHRLYAILHDSQDRLWTGLRGGGLQCDGTEIRGLPSKFVFSIAEGRNGDICIAMLDGGIAVVHNGNVVSTALKGKKCHDLLQDKNGSWWVAAEDSVYVVSQDESGGLTRVMTIDAGYYLCLFMAHDGHIWAGGIGSGVLDCQTMQRYTTGNGLANNNAYSIIEDDDNQLWIGTEEGLSCIAPAEGRIVNHTIRQSLLANVFTERTALKLRDGTLLFGTHDGIVEIHPDKNGGEKHGHLQSRLPKTVITNFLVHGKAADVRQLGHSDNTLTFYFSNFQYDQLDNVLYQYRLKGMETEWSLPTSHHNATYNRLPPGTYVFHVRSTNGMGIWGNEAILEFTINEPWWNTWWAWVIYVISSCIILTIAVTTVRRFVSLRQRLALQSRMAAFQRNFYDRMERELRSPVNVMQGATENVSLGSTSKTTVLSLRRGSRRMLKLMDMIRQFHNMDAAELQLYSEQDALDKEAEKRFQDIKQGVSDEEEFRELAPPPANDRTLLVIEDDEDNLMHLTDTLSPLFRIVSCSQLHLCEDVIQREDPSMILIDITNCESEARRMTRQLNKERPTIPIVHISSFSDNNRQLLSLRAGAADYLEKPYSNQVLVERIKRCFAQKSATNPVNSHEDHHDENLENDGDILLTDIKDKKFLNQFYVLLEQHVADSDFSVEQIAGLMGIERSRLYKRIKTLTGNTPVSYIHHARLGYAARLLRESNDTIESIMLQVGFRNATHFYNSFKREFGMTPKDYRAT